MEGARYGAPEPGALRALGPVAGSRTSRCPASPPRRRSTCRRCAIASCGLRDAGAPFGDVAMELRVYDAAQWLTEVSNPAWEPMVWPAPSEAVAGADGDLQAGEGRCTGRRRRLAEVVARPAGRVSRRHGEALQRVGTRARQRRVAARGRGVAAGRPGGRHLGLAAHVASSVEMRTEGALDLLALSIDLRLSGELVEGSARSRIRVLCKGRSELRMTVAQVGAKAQEGQRPEVGSAHLALSVHPRDRPARRRRAVDAQRRGRRRCRSPARWSASAAFAAGATAAACSGSSRCVPSR